MAKKVHPRARKKKKTATARKTIAKVKGLVRTAAGNGTTTSGGGGKKRKRATTGSLVRRTGKRPAQKAGVLTAQLQAAFLDAYKIGGTIEGACRLAEVGRRTHYDWLDRDPSYAARFKETHESTVDLAEEALRKRGVEGIQEPLVYQGMKTGQYITRYSDACLIFYLKGRRGDVFRERTEITGAGGGPVQTVDLARLTTEQLQTMRDWLEKARDSDGGGQ